MVYTHQGASLRVNSGIYPPGCLPKECIGLSSLPGRYTLWYMCLSSLPGRYTLVYMPLSLLYVPVHPAVCAPSPLTPLGEREAYCCAERPPSLIGLMSVMLRKEALFPLRTVINVAMRRIVPVLGPWAGGRREEVYATLTPLLGC